MIKAIKTTLLLSAAIVGVVAHIQDASGMSLQGLGAPSDHVEVLPPQYLEKCVPGSFEGTAYRICYYQPKPWKLADPTAFVCWGPVNNPLAVQCEADMPQDVQPGSK